MQLYMMIIFQFWSFVYQCYITLQMNFPFTKEWYFRFCIIYSCFDNEMQVCHPDYIISFSEWKKKYYFFTNLVGEIGRLYFIYWIFLFNEFSAGGFTNIVSMKPTFGKYRIGVVAKSWHLFGVCGVKDLHFFNFTKTTTSVSARKKCFL